jgi:predicted DNA-binding transcriptional regulator AlpA
MIYAKYPARKGTELVRNREFQRRAGLTPSSYQRGCTEGTIPPPIETGPRQVSRPSWVVDDYIGHKCSSNEPFDGIAYVKKVGGRAYEKTPGGESVAV